jgi:hypothetical protein
MRLKTMAKQSRTIRISEQTYRRMHRLKAEMLAVIEKGQGYDNVPLVEQGKRGVWVSDDAAINRFMDEFEDHRKRSNPGKNKKTQ